MKGPISIHHLRGLLLMLVLALVVRQWVWMPALAAGESMQPTLRWGQFVGVNKLAYHLGRPRRGDIVEVQTSMGLMIKRVIGLPGETIALQMGVFYVNGRELSEPYVEYRDHCSIGTGELGPDSYVVAGDNRCKTIIAVVNRDRIVGRVMRERSAPQAASGLTSSSTVAFVGGENVLTRSMINLVQLFRLKQ